MIAQTIAQRVTRVVKIRCQPNVVLVRSNKKEEEHT